MSNTGIELYSRIQDPLSAITKVGEFFAKSGMFGCERTEQGQVLAMECLATNKPPSVIARTYHIMDGKLSKKALAALAEFRAIGGKHKWRATGADGKRAELELALDGNTIAVQFTIEEARAQGLIRPKSAWEKTPGNMLRARCISNGVAMLAPEIFAGDVEDEIESSLRPAEPLLPEKPIQQSAPTAPVETVIEVQEVKSTEVKPTETPKPTEPAAPPAIPFEAKSVDGKLTVETQRAIIAAIGEQNMVALMKHLKTAGNAPGNGWLTEAQDLEDLPAKRAQLLINQAENVKRRIGAK